MKNLDWLEQLHVAHYPTLLRLAKNRLYHALGNTAEAEDVVQEAFMLALKKDISQHDAPLGWLLKAVENLCKRRVERTAVRQQKQQILQQEVSVRERQATSPEADFSAEETLAHIADAIAPEDWQLLMDYCVTKRPPEEIARELNTSVSALRVRIHRLRTQVKKNSRNM